MQEENVQKDKWVAENAFISEVQSQSDFPQDQHQGGH